MTTLTEDIRKIMREECETLGDRIIGGKPVRLTQTTAEIQDAMLRALDRQRAKERRIILWCCIGGVLLLAIGFAFGAGLTWALRV
jgi:hypothetical protein